MLLSLAHAGHECLMTVATLFHSCSICLLSKWNLSLHLRLWCEPASSSGFKTSSFSPPRSITHPPLNHRDLDISPSPRACRIDRLSHVVAPSQVSTGTTPTTISPLHWESESLGLSPHCVSLGSSLTFLGLSLSICKMKRKEMLSATNCSEL